MTDLKVNPHFFRGNGLRSSTTISLNNKPAAVITRSADAGELELKSPTKLCQEINHAGPEVNLNANVTV